MFGRFLLPCAHSDRFYGSQSEGGDVVCLVENGKGFPQRWTVFSCDVKEEMALIARGMG